MMTAPSTVGLASGLVGFDGLCGALSGTDDLGRVSTRRFACAPGPGRVDGAAAH